MQIDKVEFMKIDGLKPYPFYISELIRTCTSCFKK